MFWANLGVPEGSEPGCYRPVVILQNDLFNSSGIATVVVCSLTTRMKFSDAPGNVVLAKGVANLPSRSLANITQISTIDRSSLGDKIGTLPFPLLRQILDGVLFLLEPRPPKTAKNPSAAD